MKKIMFIGLLQFSFFCCAQEELNAFLTEQPEELSIEVESSAVQKALLKNESKWCVTNPINGKRAWGVYSGLSELSPYGLSILCMILTAQPRGQETMDTDEVRSMKDKIFNASLLCLINKFIYDTARFYRFCSDD